MDKLRIHYLQHVAFEGLGCIENWINKNGHRLSCTRFFLDEALPDINDIDWLIVMGGPMGVRDDGIYPWLFYEKAFIKKAIDLNKTVIGICLGAQLVADVLGAKVYPNQYKEIGWFEVSRTKQGYDNKIFNGFDPQFKVFHWHGDTFDIPLGARHLFQSEACPNQCFIYKNKVLGLQFHFEVTLESLNGMVLNGLHELVQAVYIQTGLEIMAQTGHIEFNNELMYKVLDRLYIE